LQRGGKKKGGESCSGSKSGSSLIQRKRERNPASILIGISPGTGEGAERQEKHEGKGKKAKRGLPTQLGREGGRKEGRSVLLERDQKKKGGSFAVSKRERAGGQRSIKPLLLTRTTAYPIPVQATREGAGHPLKMGEEKRSKGRSRSSDRNKEKEGKKGTKRHA